jgi:uncharacterized tellurite resistance protein B-like protein
MKAKKIKKLKQKSLLKNLLLVALADGKLEKEEIGFIRKKAREYHISDEIVENVMADHENVRNVFPEALGEKIELLYDMVEMMLQDGYIAEEEMNLCRRIAEKMEIFPDSVYQIMKDIGKNHAKAA